MKNKLLLMFLVLVMAVFVLPGTLASAATMSASLTAPVVDSKDIANYGTVTSTDKWFTDAAASGRPHGQTFSVGDTGVMLKAISYQVTASQKAEPTKTYVIRVGTVDLGAATFSQIYSEGATQTFTWNGGEFMTWTFDTPVYLSPNTAYGIDIGMTTSTSSWTTGIPYINKTDDVYPGGTSYLSGLTGLGIGDNTLNTMIGDRIFHIDMDDPMVPSPQDGVTIPGGNVNLSWTNLPANVGNDVWVDVWFGTNPGSLTKVVDAGQNTTSTTVIAPVADTYYWRVDSYLDGAPTGGPVTGTVWTFLVNDTDGDGLPDSFELAYTSPASNISMDPGVDEEPDGLTNLQEYQAGTNPIVADTDGDTLNDGDEIAGAGLRPATDPTDADTDDDGYSDGVETNTGTFVSTSDTGTDPTSVDSDADGLKDGVETGTGTYVSATDTGTNPSVADTDGDGAGDWYEVVATFTDPTDAGDDPGFDYPLPDPDGSTGSTSSPVKVYIMSGQSNMVGIGYVYEPLNGMPGSLETITKVDNKFPNLIDGSGNWTVRNDVWYEGVVTATAKQWLSPGCGSGATTLGPELGFGHIMGNYHDEPVILLKASQGNRSLGWDFCPPGTPQFEYDGYTYAGYGDSPDKWLTGTTPVPISWYAGYEFDECLKDEADMAGTVPMTIYNAADVLDNFAANFPQYAAQGFEIAGYVWWQGHKDQYEPMASRYEQNMVNFINAIRGYYENRYPANTVANAPFVLATIGFGGWALAEPGLSIANGQLAVSGETGNYPAFAGNVLTVESRNYWRTLAESPGTQDFHYNNNAETYMLVGDALGRGMVNLITGNVPILDNDAPTPNPATFSAAPAAINSVSVTMTATAGSDVTDPVQYLFTETSGNPGGTSSAWQTSPSYTDTGLNPSTQYTYTVTMRDSASTPNVGTPSSPASATTDPIDTFAPTPDPATFASAPVAAGSSSISMTATVGSDATGPVEYFFTETTGIAGGTNSGWQLSESYTDNGLAPYTQYTYTVTMRDSLGNVGTASAAASATTGSEAVAPSDAVTLAGVLNALKDHITGTAPLSGSEIAAHKSTIDSKAGYIGAHSIAIAASIDLVETYDAVVGPFFVLGSPIQSFGRSESNEDINWVVFTVLQYIMDNTYTAANILKYDYLFEGFKFGTSDFFPGHADLPVDPDAIYTVPINASYPDTWGDDTMYTTGAARRPTGAYAAPGATAMVRVPSSIVGKGYNIRVGAHSWDFSAKPTIKRLDRASRVYSIDSTVTEVANPLGGGIYIEVPHQEIVGIIDVQIKNAIRSPYFSAKSFHSTTLSEWQNVERNNPAPWADFQSEKFMMNVPTDWIYAFDDPVTLMADHDLAMDGLNELMGYPAGQGKETVFPQVDLFMKNSVFAPGYPSVNMTYNPNTSYGGNLNYWLLTAPEYASDWYYHEEGHAFLFPKFAGESESNVNLLHVAVANGKFGVDLDYAFAASRDFEGNPYRTLDNTAIAWMCSFNFSPRYVPMASGEKSYQLKGHAKFVDIARLFGWQPLNDFWYSFNDDIENSVASDFSDDGLIVRLAKSVGVDVRPLLHFWGIHPADPVTVAAAIAAENLPESVQIYDTIVHYKSILPADNAAFQTYAMNWWGHQPNVNALWTEVEHARQWDTTSYWQANSWEYMGTDPAQADGEIYTSATRTRTQAYIDTILVLYFPSGRPGGPADDTDPPTPDPATFAVAPAADSDTAISMTATVGTDATGPVQYLFTETSGNPGGTTSAWQTSPSYTDTGLNPSTQYTYTVTMRDSVTPTPNVGTASSPASATTNAPADTTAPNPDPMTWASVPAPVASGGTVLFTEDFESPVVSGYVQTTVPASGWVGSAVGYGSERRGLYNEDTAAFSTPFGEQAFMLNYTNSGLTTDGDFGVLTADVTYTVSFNAAMESAVNAAQVGFDNYIVEFVAFDAGDNRADTDGDPAGTILASASGSVTTNDMSESFSFDFTPTAGNPSLGKLIAVRLRDMGSQHALVDNVQLSTGGGAGGDPETEITMTATTATDVSGVEYYFTCTAGGGNDSGWQDSPTYVDTGLTAATQYTYTVTARDKSINQNATAPSTAESATTAGAPVNDPVPDVVGMTQANAEAAIVAAGFTVGTISTAYSDTVAAGNVISQNPTAGTPTAAGSPVAIEVSLGVQMVTVPNVVGDALETVEATLLAAQLTVGTVTPAYSDTVALGDVISQSPIAGASVVHDSAVDIVVSLGVEMVTVPNVVGQAQATAEANIVAAQLTVGTVTTASSDTVPAGDVISQNPAASSSAAIGSSVDLVVSLGDTTIPAPSPMTFATLPYAAGQTSIAMIATVATDASGVEYYFTCTAGGGNDSGWQDSTSYTDTGLSPDTQYTYTVTARDKSANQNATAPSSAASATTDPAVVLPGQAASPSPANAVTGVNRDSDLSWTAGSGAVSHNVYFGTDSTPDSSEFIGNQTGTTFDPGTMAKRTWYYWRIDEVNAAGTTTGVVWSFKTK